MPAAAGSLVAANGILSESDFARSAARCSAGVGGAAGSGGTVGAAISIGSIYEWGRLFCQISARMDGQKAGRGSGFGTGVVVGFFLLRLILFAGLIYGSLKCFHGSPIALLCGLGLGLAGLAWQAMRVIRG